MKAILSKNDFFNLRKEYTICEWEMKNSFYFNKLKNDDQKFILESIGGKKSSTDEDNSSFDYENYAFVDDSESELTEDEEEEEEDEDENSEVEISTDGENDFDDNLKNSGLAVGFVSDRAFVQRGKKIGVFKITEDNQLEFYTTIDDLHSPGEKTFCAPSQMMLHEQDSKMLMLNNDHRNSIFYMDMNRGEIVEEWGTSDGAPVKRLVPETLSSQLENTKSFIGINSGGAFRIDPREKQKNKDKLGFQYQRSTNTSFCCATTNENGDLLLGSNNGDVRLFNSTQINTQDRNSTKVKAKNQLKLAGGLFI